jgi:CheY-like chemotaxis protein
MSVERQARVLVVDDEEAIRVFLCEVLALWGCRADGAASGAEAIARVGTEEYDLVLTDYAMPGPTGLEVIETVRRRRPAVPAIMLTGSWAVAEAHADRVGFTLLRKPVRLEALRHAVDRALASGPQAGR